MNKVSGSNYCLYLLILDCLYFFVQILNSAKDTSNEIKEKQEVAMVTEKAIDTARDDYVPIAVHSTNLFFLIGNCIIYLVV